MDVTSKLINKVNPFTISFGQEPANIINRVDPKTVIKDAFLSSNPPSRSYIITGVRGSGKTVLLTSICNEFKTFEDWIVVELNPELDMLENLASLVYDECNMKFKFSKKEFPFSFQGLSFSIFGDRPVSSVQSLLDRMFAEINKKGKKVLIAIDEASNSQNMKSFVHEFQILVRNKYPVFLLMAGLYENVKSLQDNRTLTFLYRAQKIDIGPLRLSDIAVSFQKLLGSTKESPIVLAKLTSGYAFAYQALGYLLFEEGKTQIDNEVLQNFDRYLEDFVYEKIWADSSRKEKQVLVGIQKSKDGSVKSIMNYSKMTAPGFSSYRSILIKKGIVCSPTYGYLAFSLPRFSEFIDRTITFS